MPLILLKFFFGTIVGTIALAVGIWKPWNNHSNPFKTIINNGSTIPILNNMIIITVTKAWRVSAKTIIFFLLYLSASTPAIGIAIVIGNKYAKLEIESMTVLHVLMVIHHIITNWVIDEPSSENNCPDQKIK